jgi:Caudovirus prohead serine protease
MKISSAGLLTAGGSVTPDFKIHTSAMEIDPAQGNIVRMIGSSTEQDLHGDTMAISALSDMAQVEAGLTIWLNHSYDLPDDLFGSLLESPKLELQNGIADIHIVSDVEMDNPAALQTLKLVKNGRKLGCSIGCMILEAEVDTENDDGHSWWPPLIITHVLVLEWSVVGIPANQRCWAEMGTKGLFERMINEGRGDEAKALAPAVKGLYPRAYEDCLKRLNNEALRRDLERIEVKDAPKQRIEWQNVERTFAMNTKGVYKPMKRDEVTAFMAKSKEARDPMQDAARALFAKEKTAIGWDPATEQGSAVLIKSDGSGNILEVKSLTEDIEIKGASGKTTWPLADEDVKWDKGAAHKRIMEWAGGDDPDWAKVKSVHFWFDDEKADTWDGYKLPFADVIDGSVKAVPHAIYACTGGHGLSASDIPDEDVPAIKKKIEVYYHKLGKKAPWEEKEDDKEEAATPDKETDVNTTKAEEKEARSEEMAVQSVDSQGKIKLKVTEGGWLAPADSMPPLALPSDVQLFNALAVRFGQPQLSLDAQGQVQAPKAFPELTSESVQDIIAKALNFGETIKAGSEFSTENKGKLQGLHDDLVNMCMSSFHPCKEMAANNDDSDDDDGDGEGNPDGNGDEQKGVLSAELIANSEIPALREDFKSLIDTLKSQGHLIDAKAVKDLMTRIDAADKRLKDIQAQTRQAEENLANLRNAPLGQPTLLKRGIRDNGDTVTHQDFKALPAVAMNDNERRWTLEEALKSTTVVPHTLSSKETMNYRRWPEGVGGSVRNGVRPELTASQRVNMHPGEIIGYNDGDEALVPCYDDPGNVEA